LIDESDESLLDRRTGRYRIAIEPLRSAQVLDFRILGPLEVVGDEGSIRLGGPKQRATLAILLLDANRVVSVERLADDLYSGAAPVTAVTQVQRQISEMRKLLPEPVIETRSPGYVIHVSPEQLDLIRFERRAEEASRLLARGEAQRATDLLREALTLWRGLPLADLAYEPFAQIAIERLEEIRLVALEQRIEADLALGRHRELVGELEQLGLEQPTRERFRAQLMLALYRSGRQPEALDVYRGARETLMQEFGIEPTPRLRELERAILTQDRSLDLGGPVETDRAVLVLSTDEAELDNLLAIAEPLARAQPRELIVARLLADTGALGNTAAALNARCASLSANARTAVFTTDDLARDTLRLARTYDVELALLAFPRVAGELPDDLAEILEGSPADVAMLAGSVDVTRGDGVFVPFGGGDHDWAALELGAWLALWTNEPLRLVGTSADPRRERRDASRLLADASVSVQRVVGVETEPLLTDPTEDALVAAVKSATFVVVGISPRWRRDGIGAVRRALADQAVPPTLLVHRGPRPGGLAPRGSRTRFTWSIEG
jgi:DNA-binding SARP family transcriptional activator